MILDNFLYNTNLIISIYFTRLSAHVSCILHNDWFFFFMINMFGLSWKLRFLAAAYDHRFCSKQKINKTASGTIWYLFHWNSRWTKGWNIKLWASPFNYKKNCLVFKTVERWCHGDAVASQKSFFVCSFVFFILLVYFFALSSVLDHFDSLSSRLASL